jgi:hypothetical protein
LISYTFPSLVSAYAKIGETYLISESRLLTGVTSASGVLMVNDVTGTSSVTVEIPEIVM